MYIDSAVINLKRLLGVKELSTSIVDVRAERSETQPDIRLPFLHEKHEFRIQLDQDDFFTPTDFRLIQIFEMVFSPTYSEVAKLELDDMSETLLLGLGEIVAKTHIKLLVEEVTGKTLKDGFLEEVMVTLQEASLKQYEGKPTEINVSILPKYSRKNCGVEFGRHVFETKRSRALMLGHRHTIECDANGMVLGAALVPSWEMQAHQSMSLAPHEYQALLEFSRRKNATTFVLTRHQEIFSTIGCRIVCVYQDGHWKLAGIERLADIVSSELEKQHDDVEAGFFLPLVVYYLSVALTVRHRRKGGLIIILTDIDALMKLQSARGNSQRAKWAIDNVILNKGMHELPLSYLVNAVTIDGATVVTTDGVVRDFGLVINTSEHKSGSEGARTRAAEFASENGISIKISEDGPITVFSNKKLVCEILK